MRFLLALAPFAFLAACASSTVSAHELDATLTVDGVETHAVLAFPDHDGENHHSAGDSSCSFTSGNCGSDTSSSASVSGDAPIARALITTLRDGTSITYDVYVNRSADDAANVPPKDARPHYDHATCRVYESELGQPKDCYYTAKKMTLTLRRR